MLIFNFRFFQKILNKFGLVFKCSYVDDFEDFPDNFPYKLYIVRKDKYDRASSGG